MAIMSERLRTECVSWRHHANLGDDMIFAAQEQMFEGVLDLGQYIESPQALLVGGGTFAPKEFEHPDLVALSRELPTAFFGTGRPAVVQHTGTSAFLPDADGLFRFRDMREAAAALEAITSDYNAHSRLARSLAEEHFDARKVVRRVLECTFS